MTVDKRAYFEARYVCEPNSGCWLWIGPLAAGGYGCAVINKKKRAKAHRLSWELHHGPLSSPALKVCHHCDTPLCVNPSHLFVGTQADNVADAVRKGRNRNPTPQPGERNPRAVMTAAAVRRARELRNAGWKQREIAAELGVSIMTINRAVRGISWRTV